jgi:hypothetical protein
MAQSEILNFMKQKKRPVLKSELINLGFSRPAIDRGICQLNKYSMIGSIHKPRKPSKYFLK